MIFLRLIINFDVMSYSIIQKKCKFFCLKSRFARDDWVLEAENLKCRLVRPDSCKILIKFNNSLHILLVESQILV